MENAMVNEPTTFAAALKLLRLKHGESLQKAADAVGISKPHFWDLERGESKNPSKELLERIAIHYDTTVSYLVGESRLKEGQVGALFRDLEGMEPSQLEVIRTIIDSMNAKK